jgi:hypothetical protein
MIIGPKMILPTRSPPASPGFVNQGLSIRWAQPFVQHRRPRRAIWNPRIDGTPAASEGLHRALLHHPPIIYLILVAWTMTILVGSSPDSLLRPCGS